MITGHGKGMSSVRETIEWDYKDLKGLWKCTDYKNGLKMRKQPIAKIFLYQCYFAMLTQQ